MLLILHLPLHLCPLQSLCKCPLWHDVTALSEIEYFPILWTLGNPCDLIWPIEHGKTRIRRSVGLRLRGLAQRTLPTSCEEVQVTLQEDETYADQPTAMWLMWLTHLYSHGAEQPWSAELTLPQLMTESWASEAHGEETPRWPKYGWMTLL